MSNNAYARFNAGRPSLPPSQRKVRIAATLAPAQVDWLQTFGEGNVSRGIRKAVAIAMQVQAAKHKAPDLSPAEIIERAEAPTPEPAIFVSTEDFY